ncbi:hypothetical protein LguiB_032336 [Lonicera macranthoides]
MLWGCIHNGLIEDARTLFEDMPVKNVVSWTTMISGYVQTGMPQESLGLLCKMYPNEGFGVDGNCLTFVVSLEASDEGQVLFDSKGVSLHVLIDIGRLEEAWASMVEIEDKRTGGACSSGTIWATMLGACCLHGNVDMGMLVAKKMLE